MCWTSTIPGLGLSVSGWAPYPWTLFRRSADGGYAGRQSEARIGQEGVSIALSRISTQNGAATDTFYVTDSAKGTKITDSQRIAGLQKKLHSAMEAGTPR